MAEDEEKDVTTFQEMYEYFMGHVTDDMYLEMTKEDTGQMLEELLVSALPHFEFPHWNCKDVLDTKNKCFRVKLTNDEMRIINSYMEMEWVSLQIANVDVIRQKYTSSDFSMTSQASHLKQLQNLKDQFKTEGYHLQRLYERREYDKSGRARSSFYKLAQVKNNPGGGWEDR